MKTVGSNIENYFFNRMLVPSSREAQRRSKSFSRLSPSEVASLNKRLDDWDQGVGPDRDRFETAQKQNQPEWKAEAATPKQVEYLRRAGYRRDVTALTKGAASRLIAQYGRLTGRLDSETRSDDWVDVKVGTFASETELRDLGFDAE